jgi:hypothetical protein
LADELAQAIEREDFELAAQLKKKRNINAKINEAIALEDYEQAAQLKKRRDNSTPAAVAVAEDGGAKGAGEGSAKTAPISEAELHQKLQNLPQLVTGVNSHDPTIQLQATTQLRKLLSIERNPPIQQVIDQGVVARLSSSCSRTSSRRCSLRRRGRSPILPRAPRSTRAW